MRQLTKLVNNMPAALCTQQAFLLERKHRKAATGAKKRLPLRQDHVNANSAGPALARSDADGTASFMKLQTRRMRIELCSFLGRPPWQCYDGDLGTLFLEAAACRPDVFYLSFCTIGLVSYLFVNATCGLWHFLPPGGAHMWLRWDSVFLFGLI
eukprot:TRINITY_DN15518_c0_g1_i8.p1 TRINITY_DN15518_c0_g1~~TRINITY_DN15518_c0_g1_i8.p1  ORF type:complete len:154 (-),score=4.02 TRINITY_DN15518_c0_g1_i8:479-940(-)